MKETLFKQQEAKNKKEMEFRNDMNKQAEMWKKERDIWKEEEDRI